MEPVTSSLSSSLPHKTITCAVCRNAYANFGTHWKGQTAEESLYCSAVCETFLKCAIHAFVQGFVISWAIHSFSCKFDSELKFGNGDTSKLFYNEEQGGYTVLEKDIRTEQQSLDISSKHYNDTLKFSQKSLNGTNGVDSDSDERTSPVHADSDPAEEESGETSIESVTDTEDCFQQNSVKTGGLSDAKVPSSLTLDSKKGTPKTKKHKQNTFSQKVSHTAKRSRLKKNVSVRLKQNVDSECFTSSQAVDCKPYVCTYCSKLFKSNLLLKLHTQTHNIKKGSLRDTNLQRIMCEFCTVSFKTRYSLKAHIQRKHSGEKVVECDICGKAIPGMYALRAHKKACHDFSSLCHICGATFSGRTSFDKHMASHSGVKRYFCDACGTGFVHLTSLNNHKSVHLTTKQFQCIICSQMFKVQHLLNDHLLKAHQCGPSLDHKIQGLKKMGVDVNKDAIVRHAYGQCVLCSEQLIAGKCPSHPDNIQEVFQCSTCGDATSNIVLFYHHIKQHRDRSSHPHQASTNHPVDFRLSTSVSDAKLSLVKCQVCSKTFSHVEYLAAHMHQHREARFVCDVCSKPFTYKCNLKSHMNTHLDTWQFECQTCSKKFKDKHSFKKHHLKHMVPQFTCEVCGKGLTRRPYLLRHYQKLHPDYQPSQQS